VQEMAFDHAKDMDASAGGTSTVLPAATIRFDEQAIPQPHRRSIAVNSLPQLPSQVTIGRNSAFFNMTANDRERLGGIEYRSLRLLLKIVAGMSLKAAHVLKSSVLTSRF